MSDRPDETPLDLPEPTDLSPGGVADLSRLLDALDWLDRLLQLPTVPGEMGDVPIGRFRARRRLGAGRHGVVLLADDPALARRVVVKVPQPAILTDPDLRARFALEAVIGGRLDHPGIVPVLESGEHRGLAYLAAGFVDGPTLAAWLADRTGPPAPRVAARLVELLARAVDHAHDRGVLHCDLKPANILLDRSPGTWAEAPEAGAPRVTDFGLALLLDADPGQGRRPPAGTPLYMAPEQARADGPGVTRRTDVYGLGAILYELLAGRPPFTGAGSSEVRRRVVAEDPAPPDRHRPGVPRDLAAVCLKCLRKDPAGRYESAAALANDLGRWLAGRPVRALRYGPPARAALWVRRRPLVALLAAATTVAVPALPAVATWSSLRLEAEAMARRHAEGAAAWDRELADTNEYFSALERVRVRRLERPIGWAAANRADLARLAGQPPAGRHGGH